MTDDSRLSIKQEAFLAALMSGEKVEVAARTAKISERTAYRWQKEPAFQAALRDAQQKLFNDRLGILKVGVVVALRTLQRHMTDDTTPAATQVRAAQVWLEQAIIIHKMEELQEKYTLLEQVVKDSGLV